jgi:hypothetical protein
MPQLYEPSLSGLCEFCLTDIKSGSGFAAPASWIVDRRTCTVYLHPLHTFIFEQSSLDDSLMIGWFFLPGCRGATPGFMYERSEVPDSMDWRAKVSLAM